MPEVYDPNRRNFRSRRRRKRKVENSKNVVVGSFDDKASTSSTIRSNKKPLSQSSRTNPSITHALVFDGRSGIEDKTDPIASLPSSVLDNQKEILRRQQKVRLLSKNEAVRNAEHRDIKRKSIDTSEAIPGPIPLSPLVKIIERAPCSSYSEIPVAPRRANSDSTAPAENFFEYAIALDTRYLSTHAGKDDQDDFQQGVKHFLRTAFRRRGFCPSVVAWTECCTGHAEANSNNAGISCAATENETNKHHTNVRNDPHCHESNRRRGNSCGSSGFIILSKSIIDNNLDEIISNVKGSPIRASVTDQSTNNNAVARLPNDLMARSTWKVLGDLVEATVDPVNSSSAPPAYKAPRRVVIFTTTTSTLLDKNISSHSSGIDDFWERVRCQFSNSNIQSIEIVMIMGKTVVIRSTKDRCGAMHETDRYTDDIGNQKSGTKKASEVENIEYETTKDSKREDSDCNDDVNSDSMDSCSNNSPPKQADIFNMMERYIQALIESDSEMNRSRIRFDSHFVEKQSPVKFSLSVLNTAIDFHSLCQKWSRDCMFTATTVNCGHPYPMISIQLPETTTFDTCHLSFSSYYKNVPFRLDSWQAKQLIIDLELLSKVKLKVLQLVPYPTIDASLIYGVTIGLKTAHEDDEQCRYEKTFLVQSLLKNLATRDCALLLRSMNDSGIEKENSRARDSAASGNRGLFHSSEESQYFLFMPELPVSQEASALPKKGVLRRIASVDHILEETCACDVLNLSHPTYSESGRKYWQSNHTLSEYVEASLDSLKCAPLNPWIQDGMEEIISNSSAMDTKRQPSWKADSIFTQMGDDEMMRFEAGQATLQTRTKKESEESSYSSNNEKNFVELDKKAVLNVPQKGRSIVRKLEF